MSGFAVLGMVRKMLRGERRRATRYSVLLAGQLLGGARSSEVIIHDLSVGGALIRGNHLPPVGGSVTLARGGFEIGACVMWKDGNRAGLLFRRRMPVSQLFEVVHESNRNRDMRPAAIAA